MLIESFVFTLAWYLVADEFPSLLYSLNRCSAFLCRPGRMSSSGGGASSSDSIFNLLLFNLELDEVIGTTLVRFFNSVDGGEGCQ